MLDSLHGWEANCDFQLYKDGECQAIEVLLFSKTKGLKLITKTN